jgi:AraC-like DNA-binding protein
VHSPPDWPDRLAADILSNPALRLSGWSRAHGLAPATVSRGFRRVFAISPIAFRAQLHARMAWRHLMQSDAPLASIAIETGFSDQPHMTRAVATLTCQTPAQWRARRSNRCKTAA